MMMTLFSFSWNRMLFTLPGTLQTSEQFFKSSARQTEPLLPPKKKRELTLSTPGSWLIISEQKTIWVMDPSLVY